MTGCTTATDTVQTVDPLSSAVGLNATSKNGEQLLYIQAIGEKYQLLRFTVADRTVQPITPLPALPSQLMYSEADDLALTIIDQALYLIFIPQHRLVRVHEGVTQAEFAPSNQRVIYRTTDGRVLTRNFTVVGELEPAVEADQPLGVYSLHADT